MATRSTHIVLAFTGALIASHCRHLSADDVDFSTFRTVYAEGVPQSVTLGDLDANGLPELITVDFQTGGPSVTVILCVDGESYAPPTHWVMPRGMRSRSVLAADVDGDGCVDVIAVNEESDDVTLFLGNGDGTLSSPAQRVVVGNAPWAAAAGDIFEDGRPDIIVANFLSDAITTLRSGEGGLESARTIAVGDGPQGVTTGDFDEDGHVDVAVCHLTSMDVMVLLGDGLQNLTSAGTHAVGGAARDIACADLDGDGHLDLATANDYSDDIAILFGDGAGGFSPVASIPTGTGNHSIVITDWDDDGDLDIATSGDLALAVLVVNAGSRSFEDAVALRVLLHSRRSIDAGDLDGDGDVDLAVTGDSNRSVFLLRNDGRGRIARPRSHNAGAGARAIETSDMDGDGRLDILVVNQGTESGSPVSLTSLLGVGRGRFSPRIVSQTGGSGYRDLAVGDLDGDGVVDAAVAHVNGDEITVHLGDGRGRFLRVQTIRQPSSTGQLRLFDYDGDGLIDLLSLSLPSFVYPGLGTGRFGEGQPISLGHSLRFADFDENGLLDIAAVSASRTLALSFGIASGRFADPIAIEVGESRDGPKLTMTRDFDGDGHADIAVFLADYSPTDGKALLSVVLGDGRGSFASPVISNGPKRDRYAATADFNEDGLLDVACDGDRTSSVDVFSGIGGGAFGHPRGFFCVDHPSAVAAADVDEDGHIDLLNTLNSFTELPPSLVVLSNRSLRYSCRAGNVDARSGSSANVLEVHGSAGVLNRRFVRVPAWSPIQVDVALPPAGGAGQFAIWALDGESSPRDAMPVSIRAGSRGVVPVGTGCRCIPAMNAVAPGACDCARTFPLGWSSRLLGAGAAATLCLRGGLSRAPASIELRFPQGTYTLTGLITDPNSPNDVPISLTNSVVVISTPR